MTIPMILQRQPSLAQSSVYRNLAVLEVRDGQAVVVERAARGFESFAN